MALSRLLLICLVGTLISCTEQRQITVTRPVDLRQYAGEWYEIASIPTVYHRECRCATANYALTQTHLLIKNNCYVFVSQRNIKRTAVGKAYPVPGTLNSHLTVEFYWPLTADYWIVDVDKNYQYAVISVPSKKYLWILARNPHLDDAIYQKILKKLDGLGFDTRKLLRATQCHW